jgi:outer membrane protein TolC
MTWLFLLAFAAEPLALRDAITMALQKNPELVAERTGQEGAAAALLNAQGAFDPILGFRFTQRSATTAATSILQGVNGRLDERNSTQATTFRQRLPWLGATFENVLENNRISTTNPFTSLNPYYAPVWRTTLAVPIWRYRKDDQFRSALRVRRANQQAADRDFEAKVLDIAARVEAAYWSWVAALEAEAAANDSVKYAREALDSTARLVRAGEQADNELAGARGQLRRAEEQAAQTSGAAREAAQQLKSLLASGGSDAIWDQEWRPVETQLALEAKSASELAERALRFRPELAAASQRLTAEKENTKFAAEGRKPSVDLSISRTAQGLAGRAVPQGELFPGFSLDPPPQLVGGYGRAYSQVWRTNYPTYEATLTIELPLRNREAEGRFGQQKAIERRAEAQIRQLEVQTALEVRRAWENYTAAQARIRAAADSQAASRERLESELRLYSEGQSNNLNLNVRQSELTESQQLLVNSRRALNLAAAELRRAAALTLETFSIKVE